MVLLTRSTQNRQIHGNRKQIRGCQGPGGWEGDTIAQWHGVSFWANEDVLEGDAGDAVPERGSTKCQSAVHFERVQGVNVM